MLGPQQPYCTIVFSDVLALMYNGKSLDVNTHVPRISGEVELMI